jgi:hypothetical protein
VDRYLSETGQVCIETLTPWRALPMLAYSHPLSAWMKECPFEAGTQKQLVGEAAACGVAFGARRGRCA